MYYCPYPDLEQSARSLSFDDKLTVASQMFSGVQDDGQWRGSVAHPLQSMWRSTPRLAAEYAYQLYCILIATDPDVGNSAVYWDRLDKLDPLRPKSALEKRRPHWWHEDEWPFYAQRAELCYQNWNYYSGIFVDVMDTDVAPMPEGMPYPWSSTAPAFQTRDLGMGEAMENALRQHRNDLLLGKFTTEPKQPTFKWRVPTWTP